MRSIAGLSTLAGDLRSKEMFVAKQRLTSSSKSREGEERFNGISHAVGNCVAELFVARSAMCASTHASLIGESLLSLRRKEMFVA